MLSQILIEVDEKLNVNVHYNDEAGLAVALLGGVEIAKRILIERIDRATTTNVSGGEKEIVGNEMKLNKEDAIGVYLKAWKVIEARIKAINTADEKAEFIVKKSLLDTL